MTIFPMRVPGEENRHTGLEEIERKLLDTMERVNKLQDLLSRIEKQSVLYGWRLNNLKDKCERKDELTALSKLSGYISHQLRNPLASLDLFTSILKKKLGDDAEMLSIVENVQLSSWTINHHIENMVYVTKPLQPVFRKLNLPDLVDETLLFAQRLEYQKRVFVRKSYSSCCSGIWGDPGMLKHAFLNILLNAFQTMHEEEGKLLVSMYPGHSLNHDGGKGIIIEINYYGAGILMENWDKAGDPFFMEGNKRQGFGLTAALRIIEAHGGEIRLRTEAGKGTSVHMYLPYGGGYESTFHVSGEQGEQ